MPNSYFKFKQFTVCQDRCAMKVGTDGTLLGALADVSSCSRVLDIGSGTGIVSLMLAQRCATVHLTAIEVDSSAALQSQENIQSSPWKDRIEVVNADFNNYVFSGQFDGIVSNPPFYQETLFCPDPLRDKARHTQSLSFEQLCRRVSHLLIQGGVFSVILPSAAIQQFIDIAFIHGLYLKSSIDIRTKISKQPKRTVLYLTNNKISIINHSELTIMTQEGSYSLEYVALMKDYYLNF